MSINVIDLDACSSRQLRFLSLLVSDGCHHHYFIIRSIRTETSITRVITLDRRLIMLDFRNNKMQTHTDTRIRILNRLCEHPV